MKLTINGETKEIEAATVAEALAVLDLGDARVATALNGQFVPADARPGTELSPGDTLEILSPMQGG
ncbi:MULTISPECIES: sulfur carrier protein ThiS [unclassified Paracoccus (in: a-proteobacteria)]|uniref:sulfur carrier protein ThiS n=1 Tax=unclassified Paracoccus (in: a-proteobacteria) TaxID=2688777 RepID=UPI001601B569|nr:MULTISPECIES: sulfur carrier protein ThiS [unclassified Paracoccus (in: a-proteobacteria)]MBB1492670.1 sulfur carrier protein ThiS [Paracoccus sp. MC1854]MBB1499201.1 sulfur carrier protein ThiS [Paracoccus sp. MC1862]QQO45015.1 sulfur carrier protein ThiS [Paracoccus sp. MC1862]